MSEFLNSPFAIGLCLTALVAWITTVCAIFWPGKDEKEYKDEPNILF